MIIEDIAIQSSVVFDTRYDDVRRGFEVTPIILEVGEQSQWAKYT